MRWQLTVSRGTLGSLIACLILLSLYLGWWVLVGVPLQAAILSLVLFITFSLPGHCLVYPFYYRNGQFVEGLIFGQIVGIPVTSLALSCSIYLIGWNIYFIVGLFALTGLALGLLILPSVPSKNSGYQRRDYYLLAAAVAVYLAFALYPIRTIGANIDDRYIFTWLFGHDFINRTVHVMSLSHGLPLQSFYLSGVNLNYYWLSYLFPALLYKYLHIDLIVTMKITCGFYAILVIAAVWVFVRRRGSRSSTLVVLSVAFAGYSYAFYYILFKQLLAWSGTHSFTVGGYASDAFQGFSRSLYRSFLAQPQASCGIAIVLVILDLIIRKGKTAFHIILVSVLVALLFGVEATMGMILGVWLIWYLTWYLFIRDRDLEAIRIYLASLLVAGAIYSTLFAVEMYSFSSGTETLLLSLNWLMIKLSFLYFLIEFGPLFVLGMWSIFLIYKRGSHDVRQNALPIVVLLAISLGVVLFVRSPTEAQFGLLMSNRVISVCLLVLTSFLFLNQVRPFHSIVVGLICLAIPSYFSDVYIASNRRSPHATFIRDADWQAMKWVSRNTPVDSVIQAEPNYPGGDTHNDPDYSYSIVPIFGERRTAIGDWKLSIQAHAYPEEVSTRFHTIRKMFSTTDLGETMSVLRRYNINYVFLGSLEKRLYGGSIDKFYHSELFELVYSGRGADVIRVKPQVRS